MKSSIAKAAVATAIGLITATSAAYAGPAPRTGGDSPMARVENGTAHFAKATWTGSKRVADTVVHSPVIAYQVVRGERPLFPRETASRERTHREQIALTGHHTQARAEARHYDPPI